MGGVVFLFCLLFGIGCPALEFECSCIEPGEDFQETSLQLIFPGVWGSLLVQQFGFGPPTTGAQAWPPAWEPRSHKLCGTVKKKERKKKRSSTISKNKNQNKIRKIGLPWWRSGWESACRCRGHGFEPWSGNIPHAAEQLGPWATTTEPARLEPVLRNERPRQWEACAPWWRVAPARCNWRKPSHRNEDPTQPKINKLIN